MAHLPYLRRLTCALLALGSFALLPGIAVGQEPSLPNLEAIEPSIVGLETDPDLGRILRFDAGVLNSGPVPLEITGTPTGALRAKAYQCTAWQGPACTEATRQAGTLRWFVLDSEDEDPEHCYSYEGALTYELRSLGPDGTPDLSPAGLVRSRESISWPFQDGGNSDDSLPSYYPCLGFARQGISPGWFSYRSAIAREQYIGLGPLQGTYALVLTVNPNGALAETSLLDNTAWITVQILSQDAFILSAD